MWRLVQIDYVYHSIFNVSTTVHNLTSAYYMNNTHPTYDTEHNKLNINSHWYKQNIIFTNLNLPPNITIYNAEIKLTRICTTKQRHINITTSWNTIPLRSIRHIYNKLHTTHHRHSNRCKCTLDIQTCIYYDHRGTMISNIINSNYMTLNTDALI